MLDDQSILGETVSHYRVLKKIGGGGIGRRLPGEDIQLSRFVALKFLPDSLASDPKRSSASGVRPAPPLL